MTEFLLSPAYQQLNILLCLLTTGAVLNFLPSVRKSSGSDFWNQEHCFFGRWAEERRVHTGEILFLAAAVLLQWEACFLNSLIREVLPGPIQTVRLVLDHVIGLLLLVKILLCTRYSGRQLLVAWPVFFVMRWVLFNNHYVWAIWALLFVMAAKDVSLRRPLIWCLVTASGSVAVTAVLATAGVIPDGNFEDPGRIRYAFGYGWPNLLGAYILGIAAMYVCWRGVRRLCWYDFVLLTCLALFCNYGPDSRGAAVALLLLILGALAVRFLPPQILTWMPLRLLITGGPLLAFAVSYWMHWAYSPDSPLLSFLNRLFTYRLEFGHEAFTALTVKIAGQPMPAVPIVDNFYLYWWFAAGPVASLLLWTGFCLLLHRLIKAGHWGEIVCCLAFLLHGFMEPHLIWPCVNVGLWLMWGVVYGQSGTDFPGLSAHVSKKET